VATTPTQAPPTSTITNTTTNAGNLPVLIGVATWYGSDFQGRLMSDGQPYDMNNPATTASNAYPMGTWLKVTRLSTGSSIIVQVTDRGAFQYPDIVDLSYAAFSELATPSTGVIRVRVEPVNGPS
jgi:rare lipoprotein A